jgi:hypothetical protein
MQFSVILDTGRDTETLTYTVEAAPTTGRTVCAVAGAKARNAAARDTRRRITDFRCVSVKPVCEGQIRG